MQNAAKISPAIFRVTSVLGTKRQGDKTARGRNETIGDETTWDETARGRNDHKESICIKNFMKRTAL